MVRTISRRRMSRGFRLDGGENQIRTIVTMSTDLAANVLRHFKNQHDPHCFLIFQRGSVWVLKRSYTFDVLLRSVSAKAQGYWNPIDDLANGSAAQAILSHGT